MRIEPIGDMKVNAMKKLFMLLTLLIAVFLVGCQHGLVHSYGERKQRYRAIADLQNRMAVDDFDFFWLADRPTYLTYWYVREGD
jgi:hypothetical protein